MIIGYKVKMVSYYDDFSCGGESEFFSRIFPTYELAKKQFDICKEYIINKETKLIMENPYIKEKEKFIKEATLKTSECFGIADYGSMCYWGTEVRIIHLQSSTEIKTDF